MHLSVRGLVIVSLGLSAAACSMGNYRVVKKVQTGGEVALEGVQEQARQKADVYMSQQCPSGFDVLEEGEAVVGQTSSSETGPGKSVFGLRTNNTQSSTTDKREWRIKYQCKGTAPATEKAAPPATPAPQSKIHELVVRF